MSLTLGSIFKPVLVLGIFDRFDRAKRLIVIAHPDFRDQRLFDAKKAGYII